MVLGIDVESCLCKTYTFPAVFMIREWCNDCDFAWLGDCSHILDSILNHSINGFSASYNNARSRKSMNQAIPTQKCDDQNNGLFFKTVTAIKFNTFCRASTVEVELLFGSVQTPHGRHRKIQLPKGAAKQRLRRHQVPFYWKIIFPWEGMAIYLTKKCGKKKSEAQGSVQKMFFQKTESRKNIRIGRDDGDGWIPDFLRSRPSVASLKYASTAELKPSGRWIFRDLLERHSSWWDKIPEYSRADTPSCAGSSDWLIDCAHQETIKARNCSKLCRPLRRIFTEFIRIVSKSQRSSALKSTAHKRRENKQTNEFEQKDVQLDSRILYFPDVDRQTSHQP